MPCHDMSLQMTYCLVYGVSATNTLNGIMFYDKSLYDKSL